MPEWKSVGIDWSPADIWSCVGRRCVSKETRKQRTKKRWISDSTEQEAVSQEQESKPVLVGEERWDCWGRVNAGRGLKAGRVRAWKVYSKNAWLSATPAGIQRAGKDLDKKGQKALTILSAKGYLGVNCPFGTLHQGSFSRSFIQSLDNFVKLKKQRKTSWVG